MARIEFKAVPSTWEDPQSGGTLKSSFVWIASVPGGSIVLTATPVAGVTFVPGRGFAAESKSSSPKKKAKKKS